MGKVFILLALLFAVGIIIALRRGRKQSKNHSR